MLIALHKLETFQLLPAKFLNFASAACVAVLIPRRSFNLLLRRVIRFVSFPARPCQTQKKAVVQIIYCQVPIPLALSNFHLSLSFLVSSRSCLSLRVGFCSWPKRSMSPRIPEVLELIFILSRHNLYLFLSVDCCASRLSGWCSIPGLMSLGNKNPHMVFFTFCKGTAKFIRESLD